MLNFLRDEIAACLHSCLTNLGERGSIFCTQYKIWKILDIDLLLLANQIAHIFRANDNHILWYLLSIIFISLG